MMRRSKLLNPLAMLVAGLFLGVAARLMDIYCPLFGEIFSPDGGLDFAGNV